MGEGGARGVRLFRDNRNQTVRIPVEFELPGDRATIRRAGARLIVERVRRVGLLSLLSGWEPVPETPPDPDDPVLAVIEILPLAASVADQDGSIRETLEARGRSIGGDDLWFAAQAHALDLTLVSANENELRRIEGL